MQAYQQAVEQIPGPLGQVLRALPDKLAVQVMEIRLRAGRPVVLTLATGPQLVAAPAPGCDTLQQILQVLCGRSVYAWQESICQGYVTLAGGHRVGIAGKIVREKERVINVQPVTGLNIRIARDIRAPLPAELEQLLGEAASEGIVLAGPPACGKTTLLRQVVRRASEKGLRVCVVDERCELAGGTLPLHCDLLQNCSKADGLLWAVRALNPQLLVCDEIGGGQDAEAVCAAAGAGARLIVTMHGETLAQLRRRPQCRQVLETGAFSYVAFMQGALSPGRLRKVEKL